jgi:hypothetical protein
MISVTSMPKAGRLYQIVLSLSPASDSEDVSVYYLVHLPSCGSHQGVWSEGAYVGSPETAAGAAIDKVVHVVASYLHDQARGVSQIVAQKAVPLPKTTPFQILENMEHVISATRDFLEQVKKYAERNEIPTEHIECHINDFNTCFSLVGQIRNSIDQKTGKQEQPSLKEMLSQLLEELGKTIGRASSDLGAKQPGVIYLSNLDK